MATTSFGFAVSLPVTIAAPVRSQSAPAWCGEKSPILEVSATMHSLQPRYVASQTRLTNQATRAAADADVDFTREAIALAQRFDVSRKKRSASEYADMASYLLSKHTPEVAYFIAVELTEQFEPRLGYPPIGQIMLAMERERSRGAACWVACALRNFPKIETARLAFSVIKSRAMRSLVRANLAAEDIQLAEYICSGDIAKPPPQPPSPVTEPSPQTLIEHQLNLSNGIDRMPRRLSEAERRGDRLFLHLQVLSRLLVLLTPVLGGVLGGWIGAAIGIVFGFLACVWMRHSMGLRGSNPNDGFFIRMKERAHGGRCGIFEALIERVRQRTFTREQCVAITKAWDETRERLEAATTVEEKHELINRLDAEIKRISYGHDG